MQGLYWDTLLGVRPEGYDPGPYSCKLMPYPVEKVPNFMVIDSKPKQWKHKSRGCGMSLQVPPKRTPSLGFMKGIQDLLKPGLWWGGVMILGDAPWSSGHLLASNPALELRGCPYSVLQPPSNQKPVHKDQTRKQKKKKDLPLPLKIYELTWADAMNSVAFASLRGLSIEPRHAPHMAVSVI